MSAFKSCTFDFGAIGGIYRERLHGPWFPVTRDPPRRPVVFCNYCPRVFDPNDATERGSCSGECYIT